MNDKAAKSLLLFSNHDTAVVPHGGDIGSAQEWDLTHTEAG